MAAPSGPTVLLHDLVGLVEIAVRTGVTSQAVSNWSTQYVDFPPPATELAMGRIWRWSDVAAFLRAEQLPDPRYAPDLGDPAHLDHWGRRALSTPRPEWAALAKEAGVGLRRFELLAAAVRMGEPYGWWTHQQHWWTR
jgi:hypothetical protein